jgi:hypothetical protein
MAKKQYTTARINRAKQIIYQMDYEGIRDQDGQETLELTVHEDWEAPMADQLVLIGFISSVYWLIRSNITAQ